MQLAAALIASVLQPLDALLRVGFATMGRHFAERQFGIKSASLQSASCL